MLTKLLESVYSFDDDDLSQLPKIEPTEKEKQEFVKYIEQGNINKVNQFLEEYKDIANVVSNGKPVLQHAIMSTRESREEIIKSLIYAGADVNAESDSGCVAIVEACYRCSREVIELLIKKGADVNHREPCGYTALLVAVGIDSDDKRPDNDIKLLIDLGADVNLTNFDGISALMWVSSFGYDSTMMLLIEAGADVNAKDYRGRTPLDYAVSNAHPDVIRVLLEAGADVLEMRDQSGLKNLFEEWLDFEQLEDPAFVDMVVSLVDLL